MNFLVTRRRSVFFILILIALLAGLTRWNSTWLASAKARAFPESRWTEESAIALTTATEATPLVLTQTQILLHQPITDTLTEAASPPSLADFIQHVSDGRGDLVRGFYVSGVTALRVVTQPLGDPGFISAEDGTATLFQGTSAFGVTGLLAHNFLSGREFFRLKAGQMLSVIYGDGQVRHYKVSKIDDFQRLSINDLRSNFLELSSGLERTADQVFADFYQGEPHLTLQTCIERDGEWSWGVRFIKADPVD
jgi:hypothetical protein